MIQPSCAKSKLYTQYKLDCYNYYYRHVLGSKDAEG